MNQQPIQCSANHPTASDRPRYQPWRACALALLLTTLTVGPQTQAAERFNTGGLITRTLKALPSCIDYCLVGIELRMSFSLLTGITFFLVPKVEHNMSTMVVMTSETLGREAWREWAALIGQAQKALLDLPARQLGVLEAGGGRSRYEHFGQHQATQLMDVEIAGHPVAILPNILGGNGRVKPAAEPRIDPKTDPVYCDLPGCIERQPHIDAQLYRRPQPTGDHDPPPPWWIDAETKALIQHTRDYLNTWQSQARDGQYTAFPNYLSDHFKILPRLQSLGHIVEALQMMAHFMRWIRILKNLTSYVAGSGGVRIDYLMCANDVIPFMPYYLSSLDALLWRSGWPYTDLQHTGRILNPLSNDRVRPKAALPFETWGHLYPRAGFVNNDHPGRAAAVVTARAASLAHDPSAVGRPKLSLPARAGSWQKLSPDPTAYCTTHIADLPTAISASGSYAYTVWSRYRCALSHSGIKIASIRVHACF